MLRTVLNDSSSFLLRNGFSIKLQSGPLDILCLSPVCSGMVPGVCYQRLGLQWFSGS